MSNSGFAGSFTEVACDLDVARAVAAATDLIVGVRVPAGCNYRPPYSVRIRAVRTSAGVNFQWVAANSESLDAECSVTAIMKRGQWVSNGVARFLAECHAEYQLQFSADIPKYLADLLGAEVRA